MRMPATDAPRWSYDEVLALVRNQDDGSIRYEYTDVALLVIHLPALFRLVLDEDVPG